MNSGSGFRIRPYVTMVLLTLSLLLIYLPVQIVFFVQLLPSSLHSYSWDALHNKSRFVPSLYHTNNSNGLQYRGWSTCATLFLLWCFYGFDEYAMEFYRRVLVKLGFAHFFPMLKFTKQQRESLRRAAGRPLTTNYYNKFCKPFNIVNIIMRRFHLAEQDGVNLVSSASHNHIRYVFKLSI